MSKDALADLPSLTELDLSSNKLIADAMDGPIFDLPQLKALNLAKNKLSRLSAQLLSNLNLLQRLDVSNNGITVVAEDALSGLRQIRAVNISYNNLREIEPREEEKRRGAAGEKREATGQAFYCFTYRERRVRNVPRALFLVLTANWFYLDFDVFCLGHDQ